MRFADTRWILCLIAISQPMWPAEGRSVIGTNSSLPMAISLMQAGKYSEACMICEQIVQRGGKSAEIQNAIYQQGYCLKALGDYEEAIARWKSLDKYHGWEESVLLPMGIIYADNMNLPEKAVVCYKKLLRNIRADNVLCAEIHCRLGMALYMLGDYRKAQTAIEKSIDLQPSDALLGLAREWLARTTNAIVAVKISHKEKSHEKPPEERQVNPQTKMYSAISEAEALQNQGDFAGALKGFRRIERNLTRGDGYDRALFRLGQCQAALGYEQAALASWDRVLILVRMNQPCDYADDSLLAQADTWLNAMGKPDKAIRCCEALLKEYPHTELMSQAEYIMGLAYFYQGDLERALKLFERELARQHAGLVRRPAESAIMESSRDHVAEIETPGQPVTGLERLVAACRDKNLAACLGMELQAAARTGPLIKLGDMQFAAKEYAKALRSYLKAANEKSGGETAAYAMLQMGRCYNQLRQYRLALKCYKQFQGKYQASQYADDALLRAGVIYVGPLHDMQSGAEMYKIILDRYPDSNEAESAMYHLATLAYWQNDLHQALDLYRQTAESWPNGKYYAFLTTQRLPELGAALRGKI